MPTHCFSETTRARLDSGIASAVCGGVVVVVIGGGGGGGVAVGVVVVSGCGGVGWYCKSATGPGGTKGISLH